MKKLLVLIFFSFLLAPAAWGIAINPETKACTGYWYGDEYATHPLPEGWQAYYPDKDDLVTTPWGVCQWDEDDWDGRAGKCCTELGLNYTGEKLGETRPGGLTLMLLAGVCLIGGVVCGGVLIVAMLVIVIVRKWRSKR
jgi:hypothetical protein